MRGIIVFANWTLHRVNWTFHRDRKGCFEESIVSFIRHVSNRTFIRMLLGNFYRHSIPRIFRLTAIGTRHPDVSISPLSVASLGITFTVQIVSIAPWSDSQLVNVWWDVTRAKVHTNRINRPISTHQHVLSRISLKRYWVTSIDEANDVLLLYIF